MAKKSDSVAHFFGGNTVTDEDLDLSLETTEEDEALEDDGLEGEIAVDVYQTDSHVIIVSPVAGVEPEAIEISATDDTITISGERKATHTENQDGLLVQEIYWGSFTRTVTLPVPCITDKAIATFKHGILTIKVPKASKAKKRVIKVKTAE